MLQKNFSRSQSSPPKRVFISYSHRDANLKELVMLALRMLEHEGRIALWHDRMILPGAKWDDDIKRNLRSSDLVLFFVSERFLRSKYIRRVEMKEALQWASRGKMFVIPIILGKCKWQKEAFAELLVLPTDGRPLANRAGKIDSSLLQNVVEGIRLALDGHWCQLLPREMQGATLGASSRVGEIEGVLPPLEPLLEPTSAKEPALVKGIKVSLTNAGLFDHLVDTGNSGLHGVALQQEANRLLGYLFATLAVKETDFWVNLSPYETDRMLSPSLTGTQLGRDLLAFDCRLKRFAASLLHPDCATGRAYWTELYARSRRQFGTSELPFASYHKVMVLAKAATVYEHDPANDLSSWPDQDRARWFAEPDSLVGFVVASRLAAQCETDEAALTHNRRRSKKSRSGAPDEREIAELSTSVFKEIVLPVIERELNEGQQFWTVRQIFYAQILATWFKKAYPKYPFLVRQWSDKIDSNKPAAISFTVKSMESMDAKTGGRLDHDADAPVAHLDPKSDAFQIPENVEYYRKYQKLFAGGVFRVSRTESGDRPTSRINRVYFSGAINLSATSTLMTTVRRLPRKGVPRVDP